MPRSFSQNSRPHPLLIVSLDYYATPPKNNSGGLFPHGVRGSESDGRQQARDERHGIGGFVQKGEQVPFTLHLEA